MRFYYAIIVNCVRCDVKTALSRHTYASYVLLNFVRTAAFINVTIGARRGGGQPGAVAPPPLEFENDDVICCFRAKYRTIFARAFGARTNTLK